MNLPFQRIHDPIGSYGRLLFPTLQKNKYNERVWVAIFDCPVFAFKRKDKRRIFRTSNYGFHNCTKTGVY